MSTTSSGRTLLLYLVLLQLYDVFFTNISLSEGGREINPLMYLLYGRYGIFSILLLKIFVLFAFFAVAAKRWREDIVHIALFFTDAFSVLLLYYILVFSWLFFFV